MVPSYAEALAATPEGMLPLRRCNACGAAHWYPRAKCPLCHAFDTVWEACPGGGEVYSYTIMRKSPDGPFALVCVTLDAGPRVFVTLRNSGFAGLRIGARVRLIARACGEDGALALLPGEIL